MTAPLPPADLHTRVPELLIIPPGTDLHRFYTAAYAPIYFDRSDLGRFNAPDGSYGVLYAAQDIHGAFAETFLRLPGHSLIDLGCLRRRAYARLGVARDLRLVRMAGPGLAILGATAEVTHAGLPYDASQAWSKAPAAHPVNADGMAYHSHHDDTQICFALFERAASGVLGGERRTDLDENWFWQVAERYRVGPAP